MMVYAYLLLACFGAFLLGSIPWGLVISKLMYRKDLRTVGSGNVGTTNAMRALGKVGGTLVFVLDFAKGLLSGLLGVLCAHFAMSVGGIPVDTYVWQQICLSACVLSCACGHVFCPWLGFKGGKGIACSAGCLAVAFGPIPFLILVTVFAVIVVASKYVSLGSVCCAGVAAILGLYLFWGNPWACLFILLTVALVIWAHRENISRLRQGTERKVGQRV